MTRKEAVEILTNVTGQLQANRQTHDAILVALRTISSPPPQAPTEQVEPTEAVHPTPGT
jgi:hypothetical protein